MKGAEGYSDSDEDQHDAYLERMKQEGKIREEGDGSDESEGDSGNETPQLKHKMPTLFFNTLNRCLNLRKYCLWSSVGKTKYYEYFIFLFNYFFLKEETRPKCGYQ